MVSTTTLDEPGAVTCVTALSLIMTALPDGPAKRGPRSATRIEGQATTTSAARSTSPHASAPPPPLDRSSSPTATPTPQGCVTAKMSLRSASRGPLWTSTTRRQRVAWTRTTAHPGRWRFAASRTVSECASSTGFARVAEGVSVGAAPSVAANDCETDRAATITVVRLSVINVQTIAAGS